MKINDYQRAASATAIYPDHHSVVYPALGLVGEAGEVSEKVKKLLRKDILIPLGITRETREEIAKELGDVLWYAAALANDLGFSLEEVAQMNLDKLNSRKERGTLEGSGDNR